MSLNWKEINLVLEEMTLPGCFIQQLRQTDYSHILFELYSPGRPQLLHIATGNKTARISRLRNKPKTLKNPPRFTEFLRARIRGGMIVEAEQIEEERIIRLLIRRSDEETLLWIRLWGGSSNIIVTDINNSILEVMYRRPARKETVKNIYNPLAHLNDLKKRSSATKKSFKITQLPGLNPFCEEIEDYYSQIENQVEESSLKERLLRDINKQENSLLVLLRNKEEKLRDYETGDQYKLYGDLIMSQVHILKKGMPFLTTEDYTHPGSTLKIPLSREQSPVENAEKYYKRFKKAQSGLEIIKEDLAALKRKITLLQADKKEAELTENPTILQKMQLTYKRQSPQLQINEKNIPGLEFRSGSFRILVGRTAKENDALLRRWVRGNDLWLHTRDCPGGYVFIKTIKGKSVPLETLIDAGNLAVHYSKARSSGQAELYYTQVKYLRRAKNGPIGLVIATQEKNLSIKVDQKRMKILFKEEQGL